NLARPRLQSLARGSAEDMPARDQIRSLGMNVNVVIENSLGKLRFLPSVVIEHALFNENPVDVFTIHPLGKRARIVGVDDHAPADSKVRDVAEVALDHDVRAEPFDQQIFKE